MTHEIDINKLSWDKAKKTFSIECSDLRGAGCEPMCTEYGFVIRVVNPKTGKAMTFENRGESVRDREGEILYDVFDGIDGIRLKVFND